MKGIALVPLVISLAGCGCLDATCNDYSIAPITTSCCSAVRTAVVVSKPCCTTAVVVAKPVVRKACCDTCYDASCY